MSRPAKFDEEQILAAAGRLVAHHGPAGASVGAVARAVGAPVGSIYHRFASRDVLLAEVWLRAASAFQAAYFARLSASSPRAAGLAAALYLPERVRERPEEARLLLLHRREDFVDRGWPAVMQRRALNLGRQVETELRGFARRLCGDDDVRTITMVTFAVLGAPFAALRPHVAAHVPPPVYVDELIRVTFEANIALLSGKRRSEGRRRREPSEKEMQS